MASSSRPEKQLKELLQEQQKPFVLTTYLSERKYMRSSLNSDTKNGCSPNNSAKNSKRSRIQPELSTKRERIANRSSFLRSVLNKFVSSNDCWTHSTYNGSEIQKKVTPDNSSKSNVMYNHQFFKENHGSSSSTSTFQAFEPFDMGGLEPATDKNLPWAFMDERQLSPISVLEILTSSQAQHFIARQEEILSTSSFNLQKRIKESSTAAASPWELLIQRHPGIAKLEEIFGFAGSQYLKTRRIMQNTKGVSFDCAKEAIEIHGKNNVQKNQEFLGDQEPLKNNCEHFCYWEKKKCGDVASITKPRNSDFSTTKQEWSDSHPLTIEVGIEIADALMDQMVTDIINYFL